MITADLERVRSALFGLSADTPRDDWVEIAMAVKAELGEGGFDLFDEWSRQSDRYTAALGAAASESSHVGRAVSPPAQRELFGLAVRANDCTITRDPCPRCGATDVVMGPGSGPHFAALRCLRGHHLLWLPKPGGAR